MEDLLRSQVKYGMAGKVMTPTFTRFFTRLDMEFSSYEGNWHRNYNFAAFGWSNQLAIYEQERSRYVSGSLIYTFRPEIGIRTSNCDSWDSYCTDQVPLAVKIRM